MNCKKRDAKTLPKRIADFIQKGKAKHGEDTYDYSRVFGQYKNNRIPVEIKCNQCDDDFFPVYPFAHTDKKDNQKGTCTNCYVPNQTVQETRWDPNLPQRIEEFEEQLEDKYPKGHYTYPNLKNEYKNEESFITVVCNKCNSKPYELKARSLKSNSRKGGCKVCNKKAKTETIANKNKIRQLRNHETKDEPRDYGCIYKITNRKDGKFYIGYTTGSAKQRLKSHCDEAIKFARGNKKAKSYLHSSMNYHGHEHFVVEVLVEFTNITPIKLGTLEKEYIASMKPHYNISPGGELGHYKTHKKAG